MARDGTFAHRMTIGTPATVVGTGLASGRPCSVEMLPASSGEGILFRCAHPVGMPLLRASFDRARPAGAGLSLFDGDVPCVGPVDMILAAAAGLGVTDLLVEVTGPEVPSPEGGASPFVEAMLGASLSILPGPNHPVRVTRTVRIAGRDGAWAELRPAARRSVRVQSPVAGTFMGLESQAFSYDVREFMAGLAPSRPSRFADDVAEMLSPTGGHVVEVWTDASRRLESLRHGLLRMVGAMLLAGQSVIGECVVHRGSSDLVPQLLSALFTTPGAWSTHGAGSDDDPWGRDMASAAE